MNYVKSTMKNFMVSKIFHWSTIHTLLPVVREWFSNASVFRREFIPMSLHKKERIYHIFDNLFNIDLVLMYRGRLGMQGTLVIIGTRYEWNFRKNGDRVCL